MPTQLIKPPALRRFRHLHAIHRLPGLRIPRQKHGRFWVTLFAVLLAATAALAQSAPNPEMEALRREMQQLRADYESRMQQLEQRLRQLENAPAAAPTNRAPALAPPAPTTSPPTAAASSRMTTVTTPRPEDAISVAPR